MILLTRIVAVVLSCSALSACSKPLCEDVPVRSDRDGLRLETGGERLKAIGGEFFGFNLETVEFQLSLWVGSKRIVHESAVEALKPFAGAVYRLPGGSTANFYRWRDGVGEPSKRPPARITDWITIPRIDFGIDEYLTFLDTVGGTGWFIVNLQGSYDDPAEPGLLADEAADLARYLLKTPRGRNGGVFLRWELGNELDRGRDMWSSRKYLHHASVALDAIRKADPNARFVGMMQDYDAQRSLGIKASEYNEQVAKRLQPQGVVEYQQHFYYDGPPHGPWMPQRLGQLCQAIESARKGGVEPAAMTFWVTEHARWPQPDTPGAEWKSSWRRTADAEAALGIADMMIGLTQVPTVQGGFLHALHGMGGPWPTFHSLNGDAGPFHPSVSLYAYQTLRKALLPVVLKTRSASPDRAGYGGGYDARGAVLTSEDRREFAVWTVNRWERPMPTSLRIPELAKRRVTATMTAMAASGPRDHNYERRDLVRPVSTSVELTFDADGNTTFSLPGRSVSTVYFRVAD